MKKLNALETKFLEKLAVYAGFDGGYFIMDAVFCDETENFISNPEPDIGEEIIVKIRTAVGNVGKAILCTENMEYECAKLDSDELFDYYGAKIKITAKVRYYFKILRDSDIFCYNKRGLFRDVDRDYDFMIIPDFKTPDWAKGAVMYQIYVDRFYNGDKKNDVVNMEYAYLGRVAKKIADWNQPVAAEDTCNFYGGDLQGVIEKMAYLSDLGVEVIYFNPLFVSPSSHKYDVQDYDYIDPHFGVIVNDGGAALSFDNFHNKFASMYMQRTTDKFNLEASNLLFAELVKVAHKNGIKVILDGVFNHCGSFNKWLDRENFYGQNGYPVGAYREENSLYHDFFKWYDEAWPNNECYDSWWGHENHPKLYFEESKKLRDIFIGIACKWLMPPFNADGWRLDVAADLGYSKEFNHQFWREFRESVKKVKPDAFILAEHYGEPGEWLLGDQWDSIMNYDAFMEPVTWFFTGMQKHSEQFKPEMLCNAMAFEGSMRYFSAKFPIQSLQTAMNELSNHDHSRFLTRTNMTVGRLHTVGTEMANANTNMSIMLEAVALQMTWQGAPTVYYGDEAGLAGWADPDNRRVYPWGNENRVLIDFHREMIKIHRSSLAIRKGSLEYLYMNQGIISYCRFLGGEVIICAFNNNPTDKEISLPVWKAGIGGKTKLYKLISTGEGVFDLTKKKVFTVDGVLKINLRAYSSVVLSNNAKIV